MARNVIPCGRELRHMATADYWPDILERLDNYEAKNARRTTWHHERGKDYRNEKARRKEWERAQRREQIEEGMQRDIFTAFLLLDDYREHNFRTKCCGTNRAGWEYQVTQPASPSPPSTPSRQLAITDSSLTILEVQPAGIGMPKGRPLRVDVMVAQDQAYTTRQLKDTLGYDTPRPLTNDNCHLCDTTCGDHRQL